MLEIWRKEVTCGRRKS